MFKLILSLALLFALCVQYGSAVAQSFGTYNSGRFPYGIGVPASWGKPQADAVRGGEIVSWTEKGGVQLTVSARPLSSANKGAYKSVKQIPNISEMLTGSSVAGAKPDIVASGWTVLSNNDAYWMKLNLLHRALDQELWIHTYLVMTLVDDVIYIVMVKVPAKSKSAATAKFDSQWPRLKPVVSSFVLSR